MNKVIIFYLSFSFSALVFAEEPTSINKAVDTMIEKAITTDGAQFRAYADELLAKQKNMQINLTEQQKQELAKIKGNLQPEEHVDDENYTSLQLENSSQVLIFASLSMPKGSLVRLQQEAAKINAKVLFRGFIENSPNKTLDKLAEVFGDTAWETQIDPIAFREFTITLVPAVVVLPKQKTEHNNNTKQYEIVCGDLPLEAALEHLAVYGGVAKVAAQELLTKYRAPDA